MGVIYVDLLGNAIHINDIQNVLYFIMFSIIDLKRIESKYLYQKK